MRRYDARATTIDAPTSSIWLKHGRGSKQAPRRARTARALQVVRPPTRRELHLRRQVQGAKYGRSPRAASSARPLRCPSTAGSWTATGGRVRCSSTAE